MKTSGVHLLVELSGCAPDRLHDIDFVRETLLRAAAVMNVTVVGAIFHRFSPLGVSGVIIIAESHLSIHTWPEAHYAAVDIYTCGEGDPDPAVRDIAERCEARQTKVLRILRGLERKASDGADDKSFAVMGHRRTNAGVLDER